MKLKQSLKAEEEEDEMKESKKRTRVNIFPHIDINIFCTYKALPFRTSVNFNQI